MSCLDNLDAGGCPVSGQTPGLIAAELSVSLSATAPTTDNSRGRQGAPGGSAQAECSSSALPQDPLIEGKLGLPQGRTGTSSHSSISTTKSGGSMHPSCSSLPPVGSPPSSSVEPHDSSPSSSSMHQEDEGGYQGLAAIAGNLAASLSDMLGSDTDEVTLGADEDAHRPQQAQHAQQDAQQGYFAQLPQGRQAQQAQDAQQGQQLVMDNTDLRIRAAAAMAALEAAAAASSIVSGLTDLAMQAAPDTSAAERAFSTASGLTEHRARAAALAEAAGTTSSTVSGITELAAAGASLVDIAAALPSAAATAAATAAADGHGGGGGSNPFGLSSAHSVDGYALVNAISASSSVVSDVTELLTRPPATAAAGTLESDT
ncbi:hypothetical protein ABBQ38_010760 [Trebouxia sp. C0009 RCD-2024]